MKQRMTTVAVAALVALGMVAGCTQMPTEKRSVVDVRPQIAFKFEADRIGAARVIVDGLDMGVAADYRDGVAALRLLPGSHTLRVVLDSESLLDERFYIADGVSRTFILK